MSKLKNVLMGSAAALMMAGIASLPAQAVPTVNQEEAAQIRELESKGWATPSDLAARSLLVAAADLGERIVAVGQFGHVVISDDRGETWRQASQVPTQALLTGVYFVDDKTGYAVGHDAVIIKTEDGGETWELKYSDPEAEMPLFSVMFADARHGIAVGAFSTALSTTDGGETWNLQSVIPDPPPPLEGLEYEPHLNGLFRGPNGSLFIAAETGFIFRSTDSGANWEPIKTPYFGSFWGGITLNDGSILIYGMRGNVWRSDDGGTTWAQVDTGSRKSFGGATLLEDGTVVLAGLNGGVAYSSDNGRSFDVVDRPDRKGYSAVVNGPDGHVIIFGEPGAVKHPDNAEAFRSGS